jgi:hypothetical protein
MARRFAGGALLAAVLALTAIVSPAAAASFTFNIGSPVGTPSCGGESGTGSSPVSGSLVCSPIGGGSLLDGSAAALFGYVGGSARAAVGSGYFGTSFGIGTDSTFTDFVTFTAEDDAITHVLVAANLAFSGTMNTTAAADASVSLFYHLSGATGFLFFGANDNQGVVRNDFSVVDGSVSGTANSALLRTGFVLAPVDTPLLMTMQLLTFAGVGGSGSPESATSLFSSSFEIPFGIDAFVLPDGVTANAGTWLVDNRRVGAAPETVVPEPGTLVLFTLGLCLAGATLRRRRLVACGRSER